MEVLSYRPDPSEFAWTFGRVGPVRKVKPGTVLEVWTEDGPDSPQPYYRTSLSAPP